MAVNLGEAGLQAIHQRALNEARRQLRDWQAWAEFYGVDLHPPLTRRQRVKRWVSNRVHRVRTATARRIAPWLDEGGW